LGRAEHDCDFSESVPQTAITGSIAEAAYGIPDWIKDKTCSYLDEPLKDVCSGGGKSSFLIKVGAKKKARHIMWYMSF